MEDLQLHAEVDHLRQHLAERDSHIVALEGEYIKCTSRGNELEEQVAIWREKYERYAVLLITYIILIKEFSGFRDYAGV